MTSRDGLRILLLGAGFTRNWGGWLSSEVVGELCGRLTDRPHLNEMLRISNNFEETFGALRVVAARETDYTQAVADVDRLQRAILEAFREMNISLAARRDFNFSQEARCSTKRFLSRFDAIFTLNQDLLLELHYDYMFLESDGRWQGHFFPGVKITHEYLSAALKEDRIDMALKVTDTPASAQQNVQPIYKLHGSVNWRSAEGGQVLVIGTGKEEAIAGSGILRSYQRNFRDFLFRGGTQVMVLGYGFADSHINDVLCEAARDHALEMYLVNTKGTGSFDGDSRRAVNGRNRLLQIPLAGSSTRELREILADSDNPAFKSFERFLARR